MTDKKPKRARDKQIMFWVTEEEKEEITEGATLAGGNRSDWIRINLLKLAREEIGRAREREGSDDE